MYRLFKGELIKLKYSKALKVLIALSAIFAIFEFVSSTAPTTFNQGIIVYGHDAFYQQFIDLRILMFVFAGVFSGLFIGEDFSNRTIQSEITSGYSRFSILLSKTTAYMVGVCMMIATYTSIVTIGTTIVNGFGISVTAGVVINMLRACFLFMFLICACSTICVMTSFSLRNIGSAIAVNMLLLVLIDGVLQVGAMLSEAVMRIYVVTPFVQSLLSVSSILPTGELLKAVSIGLLTINIFIILAYVVFYTAELK